MSISIAEYKDLVKQKRVKALGCKKNAGDQGKGEISRVLYKYFSKEQIITELAYDETKERKFKFDYAVKHLRIAIEYEGLMSEKSRHTTIKGYVKDTIKYNLATTQGWRLLRYTAVNYKDFETDLLKMMKL